MSRLDFSNVIDADHIRAHRLFSVVKSLIIAYAFTFVVFAIFAAIITYTGFPEKYIDTVVMVTTALALVVSGAMVSKKAKSRGWLNGGIGGLVYMAVLSILGAIFIKAPVFDAGSLIMLVLGFVLGALGGIIGINMKRK